MTDLPPTRVQTDAIHITLDKDVPVQDDAVTNWDQGQLNLDDVTGLIRPLADHHATIGGAVICDYNPVSFTSGAWPFVRKWGETIIDHPRLRFDPAAIAARNEASNLRLLKTYTEVMQ